MLQLEYDGYLFFVTLDANNKKHYFIGVSYWNEEFPDTFFKLKHEIYIDLLTMCLYGEEVDENYLSLFYEEMKAIEFAGQLLEQLK